MNEGLTIFNAPQQPEFLLTFHGEDNRKLVTVGPDGTVTILEAGADKQAAELFWNAVHIRGQTLVAEVADLRKRLDSATDSAARMMRKRDQLQGLCESLTVEMESIRDVPGRAQQLLNRVKELEFENEAVLNANIMLIARDSAHLARQTALETALSEICAQSRMEDGSLHHCGLIAHTALNANGRVRGSNDPR